MSQDLSAELTQVQAQLDAANARLTEMLACPQMTYTIDGESFEATQYQEMLNKLIKDLRKRRDILCRALSGDGFSTTQGFA